MCLGCLWFEASNVLKSFTAHCNYGQGSIRQDHHGGKHMGKHSSSTYSGQDEVT